MIPHIIPRIRMNQHTQRPPPNNQPTHKRPKLLRREQIHLKHPDWMRADGPLEDGVDSQLGEFAADALVQLFGVLCLRGVRLLEVDVHVETASCAVFDGGGEGAVGGEFLRGVGVDVGFGVGAAGVGVSGSRFSCLDSLEVKNVGVVTLAEVPGSRSLRAEMNMCRGLGRPL